MEEVPVALSTIMGGRGNEMEEAPVALSTIVGGRGNQLDTVRGGTHHGLVEDQVTGSNGRPVRGSNGIVGWMHDHEAADKKVSDITF